MKEGQTKGAPGVAGAPAGEGAVTPPATGEGAAPLPGGAGASLPGQASGAAGGQAAAGGEHRANLDEDPRFQDWKRKTDQRIAAAERRATEAEARHQSVLATLQGAEPDAGAGDVLGQVWQAEQAVAQQRQQAALAAQGEILRQVQGGVPIEVFDHLMSGTTPPSLGDIAHAVVEHYQAEARREREQAQRGLGELRQQLDAEVAKMRKQLGMDRLPGAPVEAVAPADADALRRQYDEEMAKIPPADLEGRLRLRQAYRAKGLAL